MEYWSPSVPDPCLYNWETPNLQIDSYNFVQFDRGSNGFYPVSVLIFYPETKGITLEEMQKTMGADVRRRAVWPPWPPGSSKRTFAQ